MRFLAPPLLQASAALALASLASAATPQSGLAARGSLALDSRWNDGPFEELAAGRWTTLARRADGAVVGWGENSILEATAPEPAPGTGYVQVATGGATICPWDCIYVPFSAGLRSDGNVVVWGGNEYGEHTVPALPAGVEYVDVAAGSHLLAVRSDGELVVWGDLQGGQANVPALPGGLAYVDAAAGSFFSLARRSDGSAVGWGSNGSGQCDVPALPAGLLYDQIDAGLTFGLALRSDGEVVAWGDNAFGQCDVPPLPSGLSYVDVTAGWHHALALRSDGAVVAWGKNFHGQCDVPPPPSGRAYAQVAASDTSSLALLEDGSVVAWGGNDRGQLNVPALPPGESYVQVRSGGFIPPVTVALGVDHHTLALRSDGTVDAWGYNHGGQCDVPTPPAGTTYVDVGAGYRYSAALRSDGAVVRWGVSYGIPDLVTAPPSNPFVELSVGAQHCLRRRAAGQVSAAGENYWGQCDVPPSPPGLAYVEVSAGSGHSVARLSDGSVVAWGLNDQGQSDVPPPPPGLAYVEIDAGWYFTLARLSDGSVVAWGSNAHGQCDVPAAPAGLSYVGVEAGYRHGVGRLSDGSVVTWGDASLAQGAPEPAPAGQLLAAIDAGPSGSAAVLVAGDEGVSYCTATPNSTGCAAVIAADGDVSLGANDLTLSATCVPDGFALFFHGPDQTQVPFGNGSLCIGGGVVRILPAGIASGGQVQVTVDLPSAGITEPGLRNFQCWFRDPAAGGAGYDLSNALAITFVP